MSIFRKISETVSKGVSTATEKAQQTVEITKLHGQISGKRKDIDKLLLGIGEIVFAAHQAKDYSQTESNTASACEQIAALNAEIEVLEDRILQLRNEKECECGKKVAADTRFCPSCGHAFPEPEVAPNPLIPQSSVSVYRTIDTDEAREEVEQEAPEAVQEKVQEAADASEEPKQ